MIFFDTCFTEAWQWSILNIVYNVHPNLKAVCSTGHIGANRILLLTHSNELIFCLVESESHGPDGIMPLWWQVCGKRGGVIGQVVVNRHVVWWTETRYTEKQDSKINVFGWINQTIWLATTCTEMNDVLHGKAYNNLNTSEWQSHPKLTVQGRIHVYHFQGQ